MTNFKAIMAAHNNADWYCMMFDIHALAFCRTEIAFLAIAPPPPYHSWMTTLDPDAKDEQLQLIKRHSVNQDFGVKDSFDCLSLCNEGMQELFCASWIFAERINAENISNWTRVTTSKQLSLWEREWKARGSAPPSRQFPDGILNRPDVVIWGRSHADGFDAGVIANISKNCVGLSNCFGQDAYPAAATLCANVTQNKLPVVGYEHGDSLGAALDVGFKETGTLRVWKS